MSIILNPDFRHCPHLGRSVRTTCPEGLCRERNNCDAHVCPLAADFGRPIFARKASGYATAFGLGWMTAH